MSWAVVLSGYPSPTAIPDVVPVPAARIRAEVCGGAPCAAVAWLDSQDDRVYVDERINLERDTQAQGYLVHEFVHHLQRQSGKLRVGLDCKGRLALEREAYGVQLRFLTESGDAGGAPAAALSLLEFSCRDAPAAGSVPPPPLSPSRR